MSELKIAVIQGTMRQGRQSIQVAKLIEKIGSEIDEINVTLVDPLELDLPFDGNGEEVKDTNYSKITAECDGFFVVVPEYNHSFPGSLKRTLDSELENYLHKPVAFAGVSASMWGGVRGVESLVPAVREMGLVATFTDVYFPKVQELFNDNGELVDEGYEKRVKASYTELIWMAKAMKYGRENIKSEHHQ